MRNKLFMLVTLVVCLVFLVSIGFAEQGKKALPSKVTIVKEKPKEADKKEQPKPGTVVISPSPISPREDKGTAEPIPMIPQPTPAPPAPMLPDKGTQIKWQVLSCGGTKGSSTSYQMGNTVTQTGVGYGSSASYQLKQGFWQKFGEAFLRGDANGDGVIDAADVVYLTNYLYIHGPAPTLLAAGDVDCDGTINAADVVYLTNYLYIHGPSPGC
jgi:hypothetical protein